jgi:P-type Ca2+ transporter type 2C
MIAIGKHHFHSVVVGQSMGMVAFTLVLIVAAFEARSETESVFRVDTFNSSRMNLIALVEFAGAFLITQADFMQRLLGTASLSARQWGLSLLCAVALLGCWEVGKSIARARLPRPRATAVPG